MRRYLLSGIATAVLMPSLVAAQSVATKTETIIVTATRAPIAPSQIGSSITIIDRAALDRLQTLAVADVVRDVPGVSVTRNGGVGGVTSVRLRGAEADQTVVLIDGVKINDPSSPGGGYDFANLLTSNIERVEVLRGPQSTLYGSQAIGGVVAITTRQGEGPLVLGLDGEAGDNATYNVRANASAGGARVGWAIAAGQFQSDGISAFAQELGGKERDSYENTGATGRLTLKLTDAIGLDFRASAARADVGIDGFPPPNFALADTPERSKTDELTLYAGATFAAPDGRLSGRMGFSRAQIDRTNTNPGATPKITFDALGRSDRLDGQVTFDVSSSFQILGGFDVEKAEFSTRSPSSFDPNPAASTADNQINALFIQAQARPTKGLTATLGVRATDNDRFGTALNARATMAYALNDDSTILRASIGNGFKAPTLFQLFSDFGNVILEPEESSAWDGGIEQHFFARRLMVGATYFNRDTTNQIDFASCFRVVSPICINRPFGTYNNIAKTSAEGVEVTFEARPWAGLRVSGALTDMQTRNQSLGSNFDKALARRADQTSSLTIGYGWQQGHDVSVSVSDIGDSFDNASNSRVLKGYQLVTLRGQFQITRQVSIYGRIENATDEVYQTTFGYGSPRKQAFLGIRSRF
jgi:vitamin B12 transporter